MFTIGCFFDFSGLCCILADVVVDYQTWLVVHDFQLCNFRLDFACIH